MDTTPSRLAADSAAEPFERLPDEIIEQILLAADPSGFASLVVINTKWRAVSQRPHHYLHHLAQTYPPYAWSRSDLPPPDDESLPRLRQLLARQVKRNLFDSYLRPKQTLVRLVSNSISSSSCPGGEGMQFGASPRGHHVLAYNSSRIYVIDVRGESLEVKRELKILRRPVSACITDDASLLAVLSTEMQVDLYDLQSTPPRRRQSLVLADSSRTIALSSCGSVLAAAYEGGIEVSSLDPGALPTDRRAVKCDAVDALAFSLDGTQILGTTIHSSPPSTVVLTAPYYDPSSQLADSNLSAMWTTSILFPSTSRDCSHAILLQDGGHGEAEWTFTYDRSFETFRAVRLDDLRNGTTYFTGPVPKATSQSKLVPCTLPASSYHGELVAAGFQGKEVWIYGVPGGLDALPEAASSNANSPSNSSGLGRHSSVQSNLSRHPSTRAHDIENDTVPRWQVLCDKLRNNFVAGYKISELTGVSNVKWVTGFAGTTPRERLVVTAPGVSGPRLATDEEDIDFVDGGRIALLDFDYSLSNGEQSEVTIEVGTGEAEVLEEEKRDIETEVAIVRRRTVAQKRGGGPALLRAATATACEPPSPQLLLTDDIDDHLLLSRPIERSQASRQTVAGMTDDDSTAASIEEQEALDAPYAHASPRSRTTLRRAATAAAVSRMLNPRTADGRPIEYRRADGRAEHPHESDADNWVPPPPPYQREDPGDLPAFLRGPSVAPPSPPLPLPLPPVVDATETEVSTSQRRRSDQRTASGSVTFSRLPAEHVGRTGPSPSGSLGHFVCMDPDDLYDVSPPGSPYPSTRRSGSPLAPESEKGVSLSATLQAERFEGQPSAPSTSASNSAWASPTDGNDIAGLGLPPLQIQIANSPSSNPEPAARRLSNVQTWPLSPQPRSRASAQAVAEHAWNAPPPNFTGQDLAASLPPPPSLTQLSSLNQRISQGNPRRLSGGIQIQQVLADSRTKENGQSREEEERQRQRHDWTADPSIDMPGFDRPLIISTPKGVSGAFDPPGRYTSGQRRDTQILAPVPRHPRQNSLGNSPATVEGLETICRMGPDQGGSPPRENEQSRPTTVLPRWLRSRGSTTSNSGPTAVARRPSRAERSAARNMRNARRRGWTEKRKGKGRKNPSAASEAASSAGWTDVSSRSGPKEKRCLVM